MSLLDEFGSPCVLLEKRRVMGPEGGWATTWQDGARFTNYQDRDSSLEARVAERQGLTSVYSALVDKAVPIAYNDYFRDETTGDTYRVTSAPEEKTAPKSAAFPLKFFTAEKKAPPT